MQKSRRRFRAKIAVAASLVALVAVVLCMLGPDYWRGYRLLTTLRSGEVQNVTIRDLAGAVKMREYLPKRSDGSVLLVVHGVHHLGIEEPRLKRFAQGLANEGIHVFTPELPGAASYRITPSDIDVIGSAVLQAIEHTGSRQVCVLGLSFSGGLALMAAADLRYQSRIRCVIAIGAHDSMERVARFFGSNREQLVNGTEMPFRAHDYGQLVMVYAHPEDYFQPQDLSAARAVIAEYLHGDVKKASEQLSGLSKQGHAQLAPWIGGHRDGLGAKLLETIPKRREEMSAVSPSGHLASLQAHVLLLHGAGDNVIPPAETEFLAAEVPKQDVVNVLISPAVSHVEVAQPKLIDNLRLLHWMAQMFHELEAAH